MKNSQVPESTGFRCSSLYIWPAIPSSVVFADLFTKISWFVRYIWIAIPSSVVYADLFTKISWFVRYIWPDRFVFVIRLIIVDTNGSKLEPSLGWYGVISKGIWVLGASSSLGLDLEILPFLICSCLVFHCCWSIRHDLLFFGISVCWIFWNVISSLPSHEILRVASVTSCAYKKTSWPSELPEHAIHDEITPKKYPTVDIWWWEYHSPWKIQWKEGALA